MSHNFLFDIYNYINRRISEIEKNSNEEMDSYDSGCIDALTYLSTYMSESYNVKLPKRLKKQIMGLAIKP